MPPRQRTNPYAVGRKSGFISYAAGKKNYGMGRGAPNIGPVDKTGYRERDLKVNARRAAIQRRLQSR
jgi:hypothetical protein